MADSPDPRFLGGEKAVITDTSKMALVVCVDWDGAADIKCNVSNEDAATWLRMVADHIAARSGGAT